MSEKMTFSQRLMTWAENYTDAVLDRFLYPFILAAFILTTKGLWTTNEVGQVVWLTVGHDLIGDRPARLFGLMSLIPMNFTAARIVMCVITLIASAAAAYVLYRFAIDIRDHRNRIFAVAGVMMAVTVIMDYYGYMMWDFGNLSLYIGLTLAGYAYMFLLKTKRPYLSPVFAAAAVFTDCRVIVFMLPAVILLMRGKPQDDRDKKVRMMNMLNLGAAAVVLVLSFVTVDLDFTADSDAIDEVFVERFIENGTDEEDVDRAMWGFKWESYMRVTPPELIGDTFTNVALLKKIPFEDQVQLITLLCFGAIIVYDKRHGLTDENDSDREQISEVSENDQL